MDWIELAKMKGCGGSVEKIGTKKDFMLGTYAYGQMFAVCSAVRSIENLWRFYKLDYYLIK